MDFTKIEQVTTKYNDMWKWPLAETTRTLYKKAAKTPKFGCHIQDEVFVRLGLPIKNHKSRHYGKAAQAWIDWMTAEH